MCFPARVKKLNARGAIDIQFLFLVLIQNFSYQNENKTFIDSSTKSAPIGIYLGVIKANIR